MNDRVTPPMHALPDGEAELSLVVRLPWEDVARLGQEAGRLASQMQRPVTLLRWRFGPQPPSADAGVTADERSMERRARPSRGAKSFFMPESP